MNHTAAAAAALDVFAARAEARRAAEATGPTVGMPVTYGIGSDSYAGVVTAVSPSGHRIEVRLGESIATRTFTRRAGGAYRPVGSSSGYLVLGYAVDHRDPSF